MKWLPIRRFEWRSSLSTTEITERMERSVRPDVNGGPPAYTGMVFSGGFTVSRVIGYRNSFLPVIKGTCRSEGSGSRIQVTMKMAPIVQVFMGIWMGFVFLACVGTIVGVTGATDDGGPDVSPAIVIPFVMLVAGALICNVPFHLEAKKSETFLRNLLEVRE
ncbi:MULTISPECIES: hypothetical protein [unclassified Flavobacterium]|uniref:hypothetical protein n=1 Tax=unclassified Flavobacterium TaxID=196869 RepID=UPI001F128E72|nr:MULTISPECIES: hypothetical protein [unclassified Flavobacterium]UMY65350.1 hypothetical protein MKO97_12680 [Flavobacterium sp. HJ-32-4]